MTRAAFLGNLEIDNGNPSNLTNLSVVLQIKDANGGIVNDLFGITTPILSNITSVDGTGILIGDDPNTSQDEGIGSAKWTFIPTNLAAPAAPTTYTIGGTLSYTENGQNITVPLLSTPITVFPQAELFLDYFHQRDVFADDPFTDDVVETSVPYSLAVLVRNDGKGDAKNLGITSGKPKIVDNEKGLLIDFQIIGSEVNGTGVTPSLTANFGDIQAGTTAVANWLLKSSLQGKFIDYKATFEHVNSLGIKELSLIKEVKIHELFRQVKVNHANPDTLPDFLVNETFEAEFTPDIIYFSSGGTAPVKAVKNAIADAPPTLNDLTVQITATVENDWTYFRLAEPSDSRFDIVKIHRSDGTEIGIDNFWTTDRTFPATGRPKYENILHFLDNNATAGSKNYTVIYTPGGPTVTDIVDVSPDPRSTPVNAITIDFSEAIKQSSFDANDITLTRDGSAISFASGISIIPLSPTRYQIAGLNTLTAADGTYTLTVNATGIEDIGGKFGTGSHADTWTKAPTGNQDSTPPVLAGIGQLLTNVRNQPVSSLTVTFSETIDLSTFTTDDIVLTRNSSPFPLTNSVTISGVNDTTYRINGLSGLNLTDGTYSLTVNGSGIQDLAGNPGTGTVSSTWVIDTTPPAAPTNISVSGNLTPSSVLETLTTSGQIRVNSTALTVTGNLGETGLRVFFQDKATGQNLSQATVTNTNFTGTIQLPSSGAREIEIQVRDEAGNTTVSTLSLFADVTPPAITGFPDLLTSSVNPIESIDVRFSEVINPATFDSTDLTLTRDGQSLILPDSVTVGYLADTTYRISGLASLTNTYGTYSLEVDGTTLQDNAGNSGDAAKTTNFIITAPPSPGITLIQTGGNTTVTEGGNNDTYTLVLKTQPNADVTLTLSTGSQITLDKTSLTFTAANWNTPQTVTVTAVDDTLTEGTQTATINHNVSSSDTAYNGLTLPTVNVGIQDNDAEIKGTVWNDLDGNALDNNEPNLAGWTVYLDSNNNNQLDSGETSTQTDSNGNYSFANLRPGTYSVAQIVQEGWKQTYPIINVSTTASDVALSIPTLDLIASSDNLVQLNFNATNYIVQEDCTAVTEIWVTRTGDASNTVSATLSFIDGTAKGCSCAASSVNNDFNNIPLTITFAANETNKLIYVQNALLSNPNAIRIRNDSKVEGNETFSITLSNPTGGATIGSQGTATVTILDDESPSNLPVTPPLESPGTTISSAGDSNALSLIGLNQFWQDPRFSNIKGQGFSTVIIDTGIDLNHPFFGPDANQDGIADRIIYQYDFADNDIDASDRNNHGSHIASIVTSFAPDANLIVLKVFKDSGSGSFSDLEKALQWVNSNASNYHIASVNLSLGDSQNWVTQTARYGIGDELAAITSQNIIVSAAAGNSFYQSGSAQGLAYPAIDPNVIAVGAVWADSFGNNKIFSGGAIDYSTNSDRIASFSQRTGAVTEVFAPGILITGANATGGTITMGGTSQSVPYLTGIATLAQELAQSTLGRQLNVSEFRTLLANTSDLIVDGDDESDNVINTGGIFLRLNAYRLANRILSLGSDAEPIIGGISIGNSGAGTSPLSNSLSQSHTINLLAGQVVSDLDFGNQLVLVNQPPSAVALTNTIASLAENTSTASRIKVADIAITDDALGTNSISLLGVDAAAFEVEGTALFLKAGTSLDFEIKTAYAATVSVGDSTVSGSSSVSTDYSLGVTDVDETQNLPPTAVDLTNTIASLAENTSTASRIKVADIAITDDALGTNSISLLGADAAAFEMDGTALFLKTGTRLDFESNTSYAVTVSVSDTTISGSSAVSTAYSLAVTDVNEAPTALPLSASAFNENIPDGFQVASLSSTDPDTSLQSFSYSLTAGAGDTDNLEFYVTGDKLHIIRTPDYEVKSSYGIRLKTTDQGGLSFERSVQLAVNDMPDSPSCSFTSVTVSEASPFVVVAVNLSAATTAPISFIPTLAAGGSGAGFATIGSDTGSAIQWFDAATSTWNSAAAGVTITAGSTTLLLRTSIKNDTVYEGIETFQYRTGAISGPATNASGASGTVSIADDGNSTSAFDVGTNSSTPISLSADNDIPTIAVSSITVSEASPFAVVQVSLSNASTTPIGFTPLLLDDTASTATDTSSSIEFFNTTDSQWKGAAAGVSIAAGSTALLLRTAISNDGAYEISESFAISSGSISSGQVTNPTGASGSVTIKDDGSNGNTFTATNTTASPSAGVADNDAPLPSGTLSVAVVQNGNETGPLATVFRLSRSGSTASPLSVSYSLGGTALPGVDYSLPVDFDPSTGNGTVSFLAGAATVDLSVASLDDGAVDGNRSLSLNLFPTTGYSLTTALATATIADNDAPPPITPSLSITGATVVETDSGTNPILNLSVGLSAPAATAITVHLRTAAASTNSATAGSDYTAIADTTLTFQPESTGQLVSIKLIGDNSIESTESFRVELFNATGASLPSGPATVQIVDNDSSKSLTIDQSASTTPQTFSGGTTDDVLIGGSAADVITGDPVGTAGGVDRITGHGGGDTLTGGPNADLFIYPSFSDSTLVNLDRIRDFTPGGSNPDRIVLNDSALPTALWNTGKITPPVTAPATSPSLSDAAALAFADKDITTPGAQPLGVLEAVFFAYDTTPGNRRSQKWFVAVNDATPGFSGSDDLLIDVTGLTASFPTGLLAVNNVFSPL